jgi:hypothetical protein
MKKLILCAAVTAFGLSLCSFKGQVSQIQRTSNGNFDVSTVNFSPEDVDALVAGTAKSTLVNKTVYKEWVNQTVYTSDARSATPEQMALVNSILDKY